MAVFKIPKIKNLEDLRMSALEDIESLVHDYGCDIDDDMFYFAEHTQDVSRLDRVQRTYRKLFPKRIPPTKDD